MCVIENGLESEGVQCDTGHVIHRVSIVLPRVNDGPHWTPGTGV